MLAGSPLTMTCDAGVDNQVDTPIHVDIEWTMSGSPLTSNDRVTVGDVNETGFNQYRSQVSFSRLSSTHDSGIYNCTVNVTSGKDYMYVEDAAGVPIVTSTILIITSELITNQYSGEVVTSYHKVVTTLAFWQLYVHLLALINSLPNCHLSHKNSYIGIKYCSLYYDTSHICCIIIDSYLMCHDRCQ